MVRLDLFGDDVGIDRLDLGQGLSDFGNGLLIGDPLGVEMRTDCAKAFGEDGAALLPSVAGSLCAKLICKGRFVPSGNSASARRAATKLRTMTRDAAIAVWVRKSVAAITTPCSVKAQGALRRPPWPLEITFCDFKSSHSTAVS